jgi:hypothetical protein
MEASPAKVLASLIAARFASDGAWPAAISAHCYSTASTKSARAARTIASARAMSAWAEDLSRSSAVGPIGVFPPASSTKASMAARATPKQIDDGWRVALRQVH